MEIVLVVVGRTTTPYIQSGIDDYTARLRHYVPFSIKVIADPRNSRNLSAEQRKEAEGKLILAETTPADMVVLLDEHGREYRSIEFARFLEKSLASGRKRLVFVVGGPYGFSPAVYARADSKLSLSKLTFSHEMVRLFFVEQIYRGMTILRGEPYHHE